MRNFSTENLDTRPFLSINFFATGNFLKQHRRVPLQIFSALWDKNFSTENCDAPFLLPPLLSINFFDTGNFVQHRRVPLRSFSVLWDKTILTENRDTRPLSYPWHFSVPEIFWNTEKFLDEIFSTENRDTLLHKVQKSVVELMFVKTLKANQNSCFVFNRLQSWSKYL